MRIRHATEADFPEIAAVHIQSWRDAYLGVLPAEFLGDPLEQEFTRYWYDIEIQNDDTVMVAEEGSLAGFIAIWCRPEPYIDNLHVLPSFRSKNIGSALMRSAAQKLITQGHTTAYLWVFESNDKAIRFYDRLGGTRTNRVVKNIFDYQVPSWQIDWKDLSRVVSSQDHFI